MENNKINPVRNYGVKKDKTMLAKKISNGVKIIFIGTPEFGATILEGLIENDYKPVLVITALDKLVGRKQILTPSPVKVIAQKYNIPIEQSEKIQNSKFKIQNLGPDLIICAAYGQIIPGEILKIPQYGCLNVHPSLLPKYRGPSPIQTTILNGDKETGVTIILMDEKIDHGSILAKRELEIPNPKSQIPNPDFIEDPRRSRDKSQILNSKITYQELHDKLAEIGAKLLIKTIPDWISGKIKPRVQDESKATYTKIIKKEDGKIDWSKPAKEIERQIRAFHPWPGSFTIWKGKMIKILEADISENNKLIIKKLQPEGKKPMTFEDFKRGHYGFNLPL